MIPVFFLRQSCTRAVQGCHEPDGERTSRVEVFGAVVESKDSIPQSINFLTILGNFPHLMTVFVIQKGPAWR